MKKILRKSLAIFLLPAFVIHELSHIIFALMLLRIPTYIKLDIKKNRPLNGHIYYNSEKFNNPISEIIINLAPIVPIITSLVLSFFYIEALYVFIYFILAFNYSLPSLGDLNNCLEAIKSNKRVGDYRKTMALMDWLYPERVHKRELEEELHELELLHAEDSLPEAKKIEIEKRYDIIFEKLYGF